MKRRIYVELDSLLDTRLATLIRIDEAEASKALELGYRERLSDVWSQLGLNINQDVYAERYRKRDRATLQAARPSGIVPMVHQLVGALGKMADNTPFVEAVTLDVNFWPYQLTEGNAKRFWRRCGSPLGGRAGGLGLLLPKELTPKLIDQCWDGVIMYDFNTWLVENEERLKDTRMPTVAFIAPTLYAGRMPTAQETYVEEMGRSRPSRRWRRCWWST